MHNLYNLLLVVGILLELRFNLTEIVNSIIAIKPIAGRLENIRCLSKLNDENNSYSYDPLVIVDYAHTPDALEKILKTLKPAVISKGGKLHCIFGAGGDRDKNKRSKMGKIALNFSDSITITSDNPRSEDPDLIINEILNGIKLDQKISIESDRALAIMRSIWIGNATDTILLAGKGNETYQEIGNKKLFFDDREWARLALFLPKIKGINSDTRKINKGELFIALVGEKFDGHNYLKQAKQAGACAAIVNHLVQGIDLPQFVLGNTKDALIRIAIAWRKRFNIPIIAVVGSNGKTTTKEMISSIIKNFYGTSKCLASIGNFNNIIGVSLSLLKLRSQHSVAVFELGTSHPGEIKILSKIVNPNITVVTNAQREHVQFIHNAKKLSYRE
ncbi:MAG: hypothetical protein IR526_02580 [Bordetella sp.]|nr:MAG: hypothetical protein IR526_02580 [Bordetella sp.]